VVEAAASQAVVEAAEAAAAAEVGVLAKLLRQRSLHPGDKMYEHR